MPTLSLAASRMASRTCKRSRSDPRMRHVRMRMPRSRRLRRPRARRGTCARQRRRGPARWLGRRVDLGQVHGGQVGRRFLQRQHLRFQIPAVVRVAHQAIDRRDLVAAAFHLDVVDCVQRDGVELDGLGRHSGGSLPDTPRSSILRTAATRTAGNRWAVRHVDRFRRVCRDRRLRPARAGSRRPRRRGRAARPGPCRRRSIAISRRSPWRRSSSWRTWPPSS